MKINHESPNFLLGKSTEFNDYEFVLPSLYNKYLVYKEYMISSRKKGRFIILDNGLFEGKVEENIIDIYNELKPDIIIAPDVLGNSKETQSNFNEFCFMNDIPNSKIMFVLQGESILSLKENFYFIKKHKVENIAIPYNSEVYRYLGATPSSDNKYKHLEVNKMLGRINFINYIDSIYNELEDSVKYIHLLGCHSPYELIFYKNFKWINSIDTSHPCMTGYEEKSYYEDPLFKSKLKIDFINENEKKYSFINRKLIEKNILKSIKDFRKISLI